MRMYGYVNLEWDELINNCNESLIESLIGRIGDFVFGYCSLDFNLRYVFSYHKGTEDTKACSN